LFSLFVIFFEKFSPKERENRRKNSVIPAFAGMTVGRKILFSPFVIFRARWISLPFEIEYTSRYPHLFIVIPAQAGIFPICATVRKTPAFAGVTDASFAATLPFPIPSADSFTALSFRPCQTTRPRASLVYRTRGYYIINVTKFLFIFYTWQMI